MILNRKNMFKRILAVSTAIVVSLTNISIGKTFAYDIVDSIMANLSSVSSDVNNEYGLPIAFPGAEGGGVFATGGRGGTVYHVTNLNDSGTGSFRDAVSKSNRIIVFDVGGTITLKSDVVASGNISIMGQTAPGGAGITLRNGKFGMGGDNMIVRFIASRPGEKGSGDYDAWGGSKGSNSIIDHCSIGWANDEQFGLYSNNMNQTVQYTIVGPSNCVSNHSKGAHGFGVMFGKGQNSWHHNLICHSLSRNFRGKVEKTESMDFVNNIIYDWGYQTAYGTFGHENYVNNYLKAGPSTKGGYKYINITSGTAPENYKFYLQGNKITDKNNKVRTAESNNNWAGFNFGNVSYLEAYFRSSKPFEVISKGINVSVADNAESADGAYKNVIDYAGAAINSGTRTKIDAQVLEETRTGTGSLTGGREFTTVTDSAVLSAISKYGIKYMNYDEYYPSSITKKEITDSDNDGMPDEWETARGLNPKDASDATGYYIGGNYTNIEHYCNDLTIDAFPAGTVTLSPTLSEIENNYASVMSDYDSLKLSKSKISSETDLTLPTSGVSKNTDVRWSSSSDNIIIKNNQIVGVIRQSGSDEKVVLTATITGGNGFSAIKYFTVTVLSYTTSWFASSKDVLTAGTTLMNNLTSLFDATLGTLSSNLTVSGSTYKSYLSSTENGAYNDGVGSGTCLKYTAPSDGTLIAYAGDIAYTEGATNNKFFYIVEEGVSDYKTEYIGVTDGKSGTNQKLSVKVKTGKTYYIFVAGSKGRLIGAQFTEKVSSPDILPTYEFVGETWDFNSLGTGTQYEDKGKIANANSESIITAFKSASGTKPTITKKSGSDNYLLFTDVGSGRDGWSFAPSSPLVGEKVVMEFDFYKNNTGKDTTLLRVFDKNNVTTNETYTTSADGRAFELKTGANENLVITDYFSQGSGSTDASPKGIDIGISKFSYTTDTWYGVRIECYKNSNSENQIDIYTRKGTSSYSYTDTVVLGTGVCKSGVDVNAITLAPTNIVSTTRNGEDETFGIDNLSIGVENEIIKETPTATPVPSATSTAIPTSTPTAMPTSTPTQEDIEYEFIQSGEEVFSFEDGELICNIKLNNEQLPDTVWLCIAQYDEYGVMIDADTQSIQAENRKCSISCDAKSNSKNIRVFVWSDAEAISPYTLHSEINRK